MKLFFLGIVVGIVFLWFSLQGVEIQSVMSRLNTLNFSYLIPAVLLSVLGAFLRSVRLGIMLSPLSLISQKRLFPISCVGFLAVTLVPMRIGELVRPYLVGRETAISMTSAIAVIFVEKALDLLTLGAMFCFAMWGNSISGISWDSVVSLLLIVICLVGALFVVQKNRDLRSKVVRVFLRVFPVRFKRSVEEMIERFFEGFRIIGSPWKVFYISLLSVLNWGLSGGMVIYCLFLFQNLSLPLSASFLVLVMTMLGISIPSAPGLVGNFQIGSVMALTS